MKPLLRHLTLVTTLLAAGSAVADSVAEMPQTVHHPIQVEQPYVRAVPPGQPNSAAFMTLHNQGREGNALVGASSPAAEVVELHTHIIEEGMMKMRRVAQIELPARGAAVLKPGGLHIMLIGLKGPLTPGQTIPLTLKFADGSESTISAPVQEIMQTMGHPAQGHHPMQH